MAGAEEHYLTQSWRFGPAIAHVANIILSYKGETRKLQGLGPQTLVKSPSRRTFLTAPHRIGVIENPAARNHPEPKFHWVGGIDSYSLRDLEDLYAFSRGLRQNVQNKKLLGTTATTPSTWRSPRSARTVKCALDQDHIDLP